MGSATAATTPHHALAGAGRPVDHRQGREARLADRRSTKRRTVVVARGRRSSWPLPARRSGGGDRGLDLRRRPAMDAPMRPPSATAMRRATSHDADLLVLARVDLAVLADLHRRLRLGLGRGASTARGTEHAEREQAREQHPRRRARPRRPPMGRTRAAARLVVENIGHGDGRPSTGWGECARPSDVIAPSHAPGGQEGASCPLVPETQGWIGALGADSEPALCDGYA